MSHMSSKLLRMGMIVALFVPLVSLAMEIDEQDQRLYDYELFKVVQQIYDIVDELSTEFKNKYDVRFQSGKKRWPGCDPVLQSKKGLFLKSRLYLVTPWGKVTLTGIASGLKRVKFVAFEQVLIKKLNARYVTSPRLDKWAATVKYYQLKPSIDLCDERNDDPKELKNLFEEIKEQDLDCKKGKKILIMSSPSGYDSLYSVHTVDGNVLPEPEMLGENEFSNSEQVKAAWNELQTRYDLEKERCENYVSFKKQYDLK